MSKKTILIAVSVLTGTRAFAQTDSLYSMELNPVIVTANKLPQKQKTTGKVITQISKGQIERSVGKSLSQLLNEQAGITISGAFNNAGSNQSLYMRGASSGRTLVLLDGIPIYDPSVINNEFDLNQIALNNVECIEICKGGQSTVYGSDAIAGVINIITTKQNNAKPIALKATLSAGNYHTYKAAIDLAGKKNKLSYGIKYSKVYTGGFSAAYDSTQTNNFDRDSYKADVVNGLFKYQLSDEIVLKGFAQYSRSLSEIDAAAFSDERDYTYTNKSLITGAGFLYNKNKVSLTFNYQFSNSDRFYLNDSLHVPGFTRFSTDKYKGKSTFVEGYAKMALTHGVSILQGADYRLAHMNSQFYSLSSFGPFKSQFKDTLHSQASLYITVFYNSKNGKLNVDLGGRINVHSQYGSNSTFTFNPSYSLNEHYRVLGSASSAFKAPTLFQLYSTYGNRALKPEASKTFEIGFEQYHSGMNNRIVLFKRKITNGLDFNNLTNRYFNINSQTVNGVEVESKMRWKGFTVAFNYTYLNPKESSQSRVTFKDTTYPYLLRRPNHQLNISAAYEFHNGLYVSISGKYSSKRYDLGGYKKNDVLLDNYFLLNAYGEYKMTKWMKAFVELQNITNKKFFDIRGYNSIPFLINSGVSFLL
ncbi:MAG: TonB-dependent receptor [Flavisolibacter sp.]|nr:TonB-dependent receptor [Flavisolibacter sp.]